ncbi:MAG: PQQ-binding-like beta-propeller repeat protein [Candidatus Marsarchaeota archaeon]|nr:PQQ-binding-like beta-propeller repeat protein [Candidatus Marsarchaeota archaeon]
MKGIVFTMDAIFALVITIMGISVLLFFQYYAPAPYSLHYSDAQAIFSNLASTSVSSVQNGSALAKAITNQNAGWNETSPMALGGPYARSSNPIGPLYPIISYMINPGNTITTGMVAAYGDIYFATNSLLYAVNATTDKTVWTTNTVSGVASTPALALGMIFYANSTNLTAANANTGKVVWSTNSISAFSVSSPILVQNNQVVFGGSDNWVHAYYASNGTSYWSNYTGTLPVFVTALSGGFMALTSTGSIYTIIAAGGNAKQITSKAYSVGNAPTLPAILGSSFYLGTGSYANATYSNGTIVSGFPKGTGSTVTGVGVYGNYSVYQTSGGIAAFSLNGASDWSVSAPSTFGSSITNATPAVTGSMVYTAWSGGIAGENLSTGSVDWFVAMPGVSINPRLALAYGRLYVETANTIVAYGACDSQPGATLLSAVSTMYLNGQAGCGKALLNSIYPASNYTFFTGSPSTNTILAASFNGITNYIETGTSGFATISSARTLVAWVNVSTYSNGGCGQEMAVGYGPTSGSCSGQYSGLGLDSNGKVSFAGCGDNYTAGLVTPKKKWSLIAAVYAHDAANVTVYLNENKSIGALSAANVLNTPTSGIASYIGAWPNAACKFTGQIADVQVYASALTPSQISQLYLEGVSGPPIQGASLVGWWPLSGDANDYANFNTGFPAGGLAFVTATYTAPTFANAYQISRASTLLPVLNYTTGASNTINIGVYSWS